MPYMMMPGDHKIAADALFQVLSKPPKFEDPVIPSGAPGKIAACGGEVDVSGWHRNAPFHR
jgi:hypothetical protein